MNNREQLLTRINQHFDKPTVCAEFGVWKGEFSKKIIQITNPKRLYLVDPYIVNKDPLYADSFYGDNQGKLNRIHAELASRYRNDPRVAIIRKTVKEAEAFLPRLDWVYIDDDHSYNGVVTSLQVANKRVSPGGLIAGDDYTTGAWWGDGVIKAVNEFCRKNEYQFITIGTQYVILKR